MRKQIVVVAPPGLSLDIDLHARVIRAVPTSSDQDEYLVIEPKPEADSDDRSTATAAPEVEASGRWPIPPIIMSFRTQNPAFAAREVATLSRGRGAISLDSLAEDLARMERGATHAIVFELNDGD